jgi:site-specific DNA recombinase
MNANLSVGLYARVSSQHQADQLTIKSQVAALRERIAHDGFEISEDRCFLDEGYSGSLLVRPALERLRDLAHAGGLDRVYVHAPDRLARKYVYQMLLLEELSHRGVQVVFLTGEQQHQSPEGTLLLQVQGMMAEYERAKILERTRRGRRYAARQGKVSAIGHAPYGYRYVSKRDGGGEARYDVLLEQARVVRDVFTWVAVEGLSLNETAGRLTKLSVPSPAGKSKWNHATIRGMLLQPAYTGTAKFGKTRLSPRTELRRAGRGRPAVPRQIPVAKATAADEQEPIAVPPLISTELFAAAAERLAEHRRRYRAQKQGTEFLLSGLMVCARCQSAYCGRRPPHRPSTYYRCLGTDKYRQGGEAICANRSVSGKPLEDAVWSDLCSLLRQPDRIRDEFERRLSQATPPDEASQCAATVTQLKGRLARLIDAYEHNCIDRNDFLERTSRLRERITREEAEQRRIQEARHGASELRLIIGQLESFAEQIAGDLDSADFDAKRKLLKLLVQRIEVDTDEVRIVYKVQPRPFALRPDRGELHHWLTFHRIAQGRRTRRTLGNAPNTSPFGPSPRRKTLVIGRRRSGERSG